MQRAPGDGAPGGGEPAGDVFPAGAAPLGVSESQLYDVRQNPAGLLRAKAAIRTTCSAIGAVEPATGACSALLCDGCDSDVLQAFLDTLAGEHPPEPGRTFHLVLDNASWHKAKRLHWHHFAPVYLPPYSPDYNAIERLWLHLKSIWLAGFTARTEEVLMSRLLEAFASLFASPALITSRCRVSGDDF